MTTRKQVEFWNGVKDDYPFHAEAPVSIAPATLSVRRYGHHASAVLVEGTRTHGFRDKSDRDRFVSDHSRRGARAVD